MKEKVKKAICVFAGAVIGAAGIYGLQHYYVVEPQAQRLEEQAQRLEEQAQTISDVTEDIERVVLTNAPPSGDLLIPVRNGRIIGNYLAVDVIGVPEYVGISGQPVTRETIDFSDYVSDDK